MVNKVVEEFKNNQVMIRMGAGEREKRERREFEQKCGWRRVTHGLALYGLAQLSENGGGNG
jgi:hypothetical protein